MRWLLVVLLVSLFALLLAAAGVARHIQQHRVQPRSETPKPLEAGDKARVQPKS